VSKSVKQLVEKGALSTDLRRQQSVGFEYLDGAGETLLSNVKGLSELDGIARIC
jgi:hypothetical protein